MMASMLSEGNTKDSHSEALTHKVANLAHIHNEILISVERPGHINKAHVLHRDRDATSDDDSESSSSDEGYLYSVITALNNVR